MSFRYSRSFAVDLLPGNGPMRDESRSGAELHRSLTYIFARCDLNEPIQSRRDWLVNMMLKFHKKSRPLK